MERYGAKMQALDADGNSALDILVGGENYFGKQTQCLQKKELLQAIEFLMEKGDQKIDKFQLEPLQLALINWLWIKRRMITSLFHIYMPTSGSV